MINWYDETAKVPKLLTAESLKRAVPGCQDPEVWASPLNLALDEFGIDSPREVALLLAHLGHESLDFSRLEENLSYTPKRLTQVWPARFPNIQKAIEFAHDPAKLANEVYGGRLGNDNHGDGWMFRGRGLIMLTGKDNYRRCRDDIGTSIVRHPELLEQPDVAARAAVWYWKTRVSGGDLSLEATTRAINGGYNGLEDRRRRLAIAWRALKK